MLELHSLRDGASTQVLQNRTNKGLRQGVSLAVDVLYEPCGCKLSFHPVSQRWQQERLAP
jgi:hypothetical protein